MDSGVKKQAHQQAMRADTMLTAADEITRNEKSSENSRSGTFFVGSSSFLSVSSPVYGL